MKAAMADRPPRKPGRPPLDPAAPSVTVCVRLPVTRYDELHREASASRVTIPELIRCALRQRLRPAPLAMWSAIALALAATGCGDRYAWAFAQNLDGSLPPGEACGQSLADALYAEPTRERFRREGNSNVYVFSGGVEQHRVYAYVTQRECETARTGMMEQRAR